MKKLFTLVLMITVTTAGFAGVVSFKTPKDIVLQEKVYKKIEIKEIPEPITKELKEKYPGYTVTHAGVSEDKEYKLSITDTKQPVTVYYTASGEFVKEQK